MILNRIVLMSTLALAAASAQAADDRSLGELLVEKGYISAGELDSVEQEAAADEAASSTEPGSDTIEEEKSFEIRADKKGLAIESADGDYVFAFGGRIQADAAVFIDDETSLGDGAEIRRVRLKSYGTLDRDWNYKLEINFDTDKGVSLTDGWLQYAGFEPFTITAGHQKVPFSQQSMTSSNYQVFQERSLQDAFIDTLEEGRRRLGVVFASYGDHWTAASGLFGANIDGGSGTDNSDWGAAARGVWVPIYEKTKVLTFGGAVNYRKFEESPSELEFASRPEAHLAGESLVDTGELPNTKWTFQWNLETSMVLGRFHAQAEYTGTEVTRGGGMKNLTLGGWYAQAGVFLTGESRNYDRKSGQYKAITPIHDYGAWELAIRYSTIDLADNDIRGGKEQDVTLGVNWWVNTNVLMRFNYVYADVSPNTSVPVVTLGGIDETVHAFTARVQVVF